MCRLLLWHTISDSFSQPPPPVHSQHMGNPHPDFGRTGGHLGNPMDVREAILREIEKESIREEIIAEEIARTRFFYAEVMREEECALRRVERLPPPQAFLMGVEGSFPLLKQLPQERSVGERGPIPISERLGIGPTGAGIATRHEFSQFEVVPFMERRVEFSELSFGQRSAEPRISEMPSKNHSVEFQNLNLSPSDNEKLSMELKISKEGTTSHLGKDNGKLLVSATSEHDLTSHLKGEKHKAMEAAALSAQANGKNSRTGDLTNDPMNEKRLRTGETTARLQIAHHADVSQSNAVAVQNVEKTKELARKKFNFWCNACNVGASSGKAMKEHERGRRHMAILRGMNANGATGKVSQESDRGSRKRC